MFRRMVGLVVGVVAGLVAGLGAALAVGAAFGLVYGLVLGWISWSRARRMFEPSVRQVTGLRARLMFRLVTGAAKGIRKRSKTNWYSTPRAYRKMIRILEFIQYFLIGPMFGLVYGLPVGLAVGLSFGLNIGLGVGLICDLPFAFVWGSLNLFYSSSYTYMLAISWLAFAGKLSLRLMDFLDDANQLGLLRTVGPAYQFRHAEFQDHLTRASSTQPAASATRSAPE
jgi:hypothetical protein